MAAEVGTEALGTVAQPNIFVKIGTIKGDSTDEQHKEECMVLKLQWGVIKPPSAGTRAVMPKVQEFRFTKYLDRSSPVLFLSCCQGTIHPVAILTARRVNQYTGQTVEHLKYKFSNVMVASVNPVCANAQQDAHPLEEVTLAFTKCELDYKYVGPNNEQGNFHGGWDIAANKTA